MGVSRSFLKPLSGIHLWTATRKGKQINPKRINAATGRKITANNHIIARS